MRGGSSVSTGWCDKGCTVVGYKTANARVGCQREGNTVLSIDGIVRWGHLAGMRNLNVIGEPVIILPWQDLEPP